MAGRYDIILNNGLGMPPMAIGTNWMDYRELAHLMCCAMDCGFRAIDTARDYGNEPVVGRVIEDVVSGGVYSREDIFITTKIGNKQQIKGNIAGELEQSLKNLRTDYVDLWLMHWPFPEYYESTWEKMIKVYEQGKVRAIGVANFDVRHLHRLMELFPQMKPMVGQIEFHPLRTCKELVDCMRRNDIRIQAYSPLCRMVPALRDSALLKTLACKYGKTVGQLVLRWHVQQEVMPVFKTVSEARLLENADIFDFEIDDSDMRDISSLNQDYKYHIESVNCPGY